MPTKWNKFLESEVDLAEAASRDNSCTKFHEKEALDELYMKVLMISFEHIQSGNHREINPHMKRPATRLWQGFMFSDETRPITYRC